MENRLEMGQIEQPRKFNGIGGLRALKICSNRNSVSNCALQASMSLHYHQRLVQVQEKRGEKYEALTTKGGHQILLVVSWYEGFLACNNEGSPNQVTFMLMSKKILITRREDV